MSALSDLARQLAEEIETLEQEKAALEAEVQHPTGPEVTVQLDELRAAAQAYKDAEAGHDQAEQARLEAFLAAPPPTP